MKDLLLALAKNLESAGVRHVFGITGSGPTWTLLSALEDLGVRYHPAAHEGAAAIMAGGVVQASGQPAASLAIKGPGVANLASGVAYNHFENVPAISISEAYGPATPPSRMHKRMDHAAMLGGLTRGIRGLDLAAAGLGDILAASKAEVPGPVHLELAERPVSMRDPDQGKPVPPAWEAVVDRVRSARRPLVIAGGLGRRRAWGGRLDALQVPVFTTAAGKGAVDEGGPWAAGVFTGDGKAIAPESWLIPEADLVVGLGLRNLEVISPRAFPVPSVFLDEAGDAVAAGFGAAVLDAQAPTGAFDAVLAALADRSWGAEELQAGLDRMRSELLAAGWLPARCFSVLDAMPQAHALVLDTGSFCTIGEHLWRASGGRRFAGSNNGRFMGGGIPLAVGYALGAPGLPVICGIGDGGLRMYPGELAIAVERNLPICVLHFCDGRYGSIAAGASGPGLRQHAITFTQPSWMAVAEAMGCPATRVQSEDALAAAIAGWNRTGPCFIEARFDPVPYAAMTRRLR